MIVSASATAQSGATFVVAASQVHAVTTTARAARAFVVVEPGIVRSAVAAARGTRRMIVSPILNGCFADPPERQFARPFVSRQFARPFVSRQFFRPASE